MRNQAMGVVRRSIFAEMDEQMRMDKVESAVHQLTFIHKVFLMRDQGFGLDDGRARTLEEVGAAFSVTRERVRQLEMKALAKLRHPDRSQRLASFLEEG